MPSAEGMCLRIDANVLLLGVAEERALVFVRRSLAWMFGCLRTKLFVVMFFIFKSLQKMAACVCMWDLFVMTRPGA